MGQLLASEDKIEEYRKITINYIEKELKNSLSNLDGKIKSKVIEDINYKVGFLGDPEISHPLNITFLIKFYKKKSLFKPKNILLSIYLNFELETNQLIEFRVSIFKREILEKVSPKLDELKNKYRKFLKSCNLKIIKEFK